MKKFKVKHLAEKYGISPQKALEELLSEGIKLSGPSSTIPGDMLNLVEAHFRDIFGAEDSTPQKKQETPTKAVAENQREVHIKTPIVVKHLAEVVDKKPNEIISDLIKLGELASINQAITEEIALKLCSNYDLKLLINHRSKDDHAIHGEKNADDYDYDYDEISNQPEELTPRPPVVTFLGHVDHGKTSLQDKIRNTEVAEGEAGKITQHIGASTVKFKERIITFIDTPGHEAFTSMRARGASTTDIAILVVAADDGFKPQTVEAMQHAQAAEVPIIVAINKIDLPNADPDKVLLQMQQNNLMSEDWGGDIGTIRVSAKTGEGLDNLLERILLESEMLELKANPKRPASAIVLEARLEQGLGATASILVKNGTLKISDAILCGEHFGRVKTMLNEHGKKVSEAGPSTPVKLVGLSGVPNAGDVLTVCKAEKDARLKASKRGDAVRHKQLSKGMVKSVEDLFSKINSESAKKLSLIIKADVRGSGEAIEDSLKKLPSDKIRVDVIMNSVGAITENDVMLAAASNAIVVGFHVRVNPGVNELAEKQNVEIRLYSIIYELLEDITDALTGRLDPDKREKELGSAKILQIFDVNKGPKVCGCLVESGLVRVGAKARVFRRKELIFNGEVFSLRRFQDDVKEVKAGLECGIKLDNFMDFLENDIIQVYDIELRKASL